MLWIFYLFFSPLFFSLPRCVSAITWDSKRNGSFTTWQTFPFHPSQIYWPALWVLHPHCASEPVSTFISCEMAKWTDWWVTEHCYLRTYNMFSRYQCGVHRSAAATTFLQHPRTQKSTGRSHNPKTNNNTTVPQYLSVRSYHNIIIKEKKKRETESQIKYTFSRKAKNEISKNSLMAKTA